MVFFDTIMYACVRCTSKPKRVLHIHLQSHFHTRLYTSCRTQAHRRAHELCSNHLAYYTIKVSSKNIVKSQESMKIRKLFQRIFHPIVLNSKGNDKKNRCANNRLLFLFISYETHKMILNVSYTPPVAIKMNDKNARACVSTMATFEMKEVITRKLKKKIAEAIYDFINQHSHSGSNLVDLDFISCGGQQTNPKGLTGLNSGSLGGSTESEPTQMEIFNFLWLIWDHYLPLTPTRND